LTDGQQWHIDQLRAGDKSTHVRVARGNRQATLTIADVGRLVFGNTTIRELVSLDPPKIETTPYLGERVVIEIDDATHRRPHAIGDRSFASGITTRPRSRLVYTLGPAAAFLVGWVGLDPVRGSTGICDVSVEADGKPLMGAAGLTARHGGRRIAVPVAGLDEITLITDFGPEAELGDCVNWCDLLVIETTSSPNARQSDTARP